MTSSCNDANTLIPALRSFGFHRQIEMCVPDATGR